MLTGKHIRLQSLDIFRGMIVCLMIIVGASGNYSYTFRMLDHAPWSGFTPTDLVFPSFLFIIGVAQSFSFKETAGKSRERLLKMLKRTAILFLLGVLINWFPFCSRDVSGSIEWIPVSQVRILGVLQRIALAYGISSLVEWYFSEKKIVVLCTVVLVVYVTILNIGGIPDPYGVDTNIVARIDRYWLGINHMYREQGFPFDPEGLLSTFPAIVNVMGGYLTGRLLQKYRVGTNHLRKGMMAGIALLIAGCLWNYLDPVNKKLWTSSFTLVTIGLDMMLLIPIVYWVDVRGRHFAMASFFTSFGKNPILIYLFSELLMKLLLFPVSSSGEALYAVLYNQVFSAVGKYTGSLLQAITYMLLCWSLVWCLDKKRVYLKI